MKEVTLTPIVIKRGNWRVTLLYEGNGYYGKYSPAIDDGEDKFSSDQPIVQLVIEKKIDEDWTQVKYGKQNTYLLATDSIELLEECAELIIKKISSYKNWTNDEDNRKFLNDFRYVHLRKNRICFIEDLGYNSEED
jgi:hypothetical protein